MKYRHYTDGVSKVVATSTYAGKTVRGVAKCSEHDEFDMNAGIQLAEARCNARIAEKRYANAQKQHEIALEALAKAQKRVDEMKAYVVDSQVAVLQANQMVTDVMNSL